MADEIDVTLASLSMAERAFRQRDALKVALTELCDFIDRAEEHELVRAHRFKAYVDARVLLQTI